MVAHLRSTLTVSEAADVLGIHPQTLRGLVRSGRVPAFRVGTAPRGHLRIPSAALAAFMRDVEGQSVEVRDAA